MASINIIIILVVILYSSRASVTDDKDVFIVNVTMNDYQSTKEDQIVFIQYKLPDDELTIIGYTPLVSMVSVHHMDVFACENPNSEEPFWSDGNPCGTGAQMLLYGWDRNALPLHFPEDVGVAVGKKTPYKRKYRVGVVLAGTNSILLPPKTHTIKTPFSCQYNGPKLSIFAAGVHAHRWARVNSLYRVRDGSITLILKGDPQQTHQSYLLPSHIEILDGDYLVGQCVYDNDDDQNITVGLTHNDEMCNVMAGYFYEITDDHEINTRVPLEVCSENAFPNLTVLIPPDSDIPPKKSSDANRSDQEGQMDVKHGTTRSTDHPAHTDRKTISFIIVLLLGVVLLLVVIIGLLICLKSSHGPNCLKRIFQREIHSSGDRCSILSRWLNRSHGFKELQQSSDEEDAFIYDDV